MAELECFYTIPTHHTAPGWICHRRGSTPRCNRTNTITSSNEHTVESSLSSFNPCDDSSPPDFVPAVGMLPPVPFSYSTGSEWVVVGDCFLASEGEPTCVYNLSTGATEYALSHAQMSRRDCYFSSPSNSFVFVSSSSSTIKPCTKNRQPTLSFIRTSLR